MVLECRILHQIKILNYILKFMIYALFDFYDLLFDINSKMHAHNYSDLGLIPTLYLKKTLSTIIYIT